jgi:mono/diheme cytochrome c family protein
MLGVDQNFRPGGGSGSGILAPEEAMSMRYAVAFAALLLVAGAASAKRKPSPKQERFPPTYVPSGEQLYKQFCASCHGVDAKGRGPNADAPRRPPADLSTLTIRHSRDGKFPYAYVSDVLLFGPGINASTHGSADMPAWGPIFMFLDKRNEAAVRQRIKNVSDYLASLQAGKKPVKSTALSGAP